MGVSRVCGTGARLLLTRGGPSLGATAAAHRGFRTSAASLKEDEFSKILSGEIQKIHNKVRDVLPGSDWSPLKSMEHLPPEHADIVIVGGGVMGWAVAYWLKRMLTKKKAYNVLVVERDPTVSPPVLARLHRSLRRRHPAAVLPKRKHPDVAVWSPFPAQH
ncbi:FAD-dependent oxidoreductase domain-containing protein 1-like isoform 2-T2 [Anomaloglossus baeobatrachus]|uniref:FAD-dependent oxidoreductase domain-containing protein 1-like isoform X2 n=1 Tax=Anomaloglossus baeobatrachus TaxID=238106 RepID=UPI003F4FCA6D